MAHVKPANKKKISGPSLAAAIISVVILLCFVLMLLSSNGIFVRIQTAAASENFKVNGSMATYFTNYYYQNWINGNESYYHVIFGWFDSSKAWDEQVLISDSSKTYADLFAEGGKAVATRYITLCEAAIKEGVYDALEEDAEKEIDEYIDGYISIIAQLYGYDLNSYIRLQYGENVSKSDLRKCLIIEHVASAYLENKQEEIYNKIDGDTDRITKYFNENLSSFVTAGYLTFSLSQTNAVAFPKAADYEGGKDSAAYKEALEAAKDDSTITPPIEDDYVGGENAPAYQKAYEEAEKAKKENDLERVAHEQLMKKLETVESEEEFKRVVLEYKYDSAFTSAYNSATSKFEDADKPSADDLAAYKDSVKEAIVEAVLNGKEDITQDNDTEAADDAEKSKWETAKETLPKSVITSLTTTLNNCVKTASYTLASDLGNKLFGAVKDQYGIPYVEDEEKGTNAAKGDHWYLETAVKALADKVTDLEEQIADKKAELEQEGADKTTLEKEIETLETSLETAKTNLSDAEAMGKYTFTAYYVTEAAHRDETIIRDVGHILFKVDTTLEETSSTAYMTWDEAKAAAEKLLEEIQAEADAGTLTKEKFEEFGEVTQDSNIFYENVTKGDMVEEFEDWLFAAETVGSVGLVKTEYGYHIMYYVGEKEVTAWEQDAHDGATSEDLQTWYDELGIEVEIKNEDLFNPYK